jgi:hypothetical protein
MQTYWLDPSLARKGHSSYSESMDDTESGDHTEFDQSVSDFELSSDATERLIEWNVTIFEDLLKNIVTHQQFYRGRHRSIRSNASSPSLKSTANSSRHLTLKTAREEVANIVTFPKFDVHLASSMPPSRRSIDPTNSTTSNAELPEVVIFQLRRLIMAIAACYKENNGKNCHCLIVFLNTNTQLSFFISLFLY